MECKCLTGGLHVGGTCLVCYRPAPNLGPCEECGEFGVDRDYQGADGRSVCDDCRDLVAAAARPDYDMRLDWPERFTDGPI